MVIRNVLQIGLFLAIVSATTVAEAQSINTDVDGKCPPDNVLRSFPGVTQPTVGIGLTLTKLPNVSLDRDVNGSERTRITIPFDKALVVFGFSPDEKRLFVRKMPDPDTDVPAACGWVSADMVLVPRQKRFQGRFKKPQPLQMRDISKMQEEANNLLNVKAVVHDLSITGETNGIDVFEDPRTGRATDKIRLFDTFLVYDQLELSANDPNQETRYWLIGEQGEKSDLTSLKGWIRQRDVVIWPSRLAVQWNEAATVSGYASPENLARKAGQLTLPERIERTDYPDQITRRLPVLEQSPSPETVFNAVPVGGSLAERMETARRIIQYYKIATPGVACRKDNPADCLSARQIDVERQKVTKAEKAAMKMDTLIVIDATESMDPYLGSTVHTIERFMKMAEGEDIRKTFDLRFGISLYGDYQSEQASYDQVNFREIVPFFKPTPGPLGTSDAMQALLKNPKSLLFQDVHRDQLEAPFAAVIRAVKTARWRPLVEVPLRFLVHVGDSGSRDPGRTSAETQKLRYPNAPENRYPPKSTIREQYGEEDVAKVLRDAKVIYVPVVIQNGSSLAPRPTLWNRIFSDQTTRILSLLGEDAPIKSTVITHSESPDEIDKAVLATVGEVMKNVAGGLAYQRCELNSQSEVCLKLKSEETKIKSPEIVKLVDRVASSAAGLTSEEVRNIYSRDQSIVTMYSPARSAEGKEMFTHWVALDQKEFKLLRDLLRTLCANMSQQDARNPVMKGLREFSEMYSSEDFSDLTVAEILGKRLGIPNLERTDFSGRTRDEIDDAYRAWQTGGDRQTWENWHLRACKAMTFTQFMEDGKKIDPEQMKCDLEKSNCTVAESVQTKFRWSVQVSQDSPTYYVPLDILP